MRMIFVAFATTISFVGACSAETFPIYTQKGDVADCPPFVEVGGRKICPFIANWEQRLKDISKVEKKCAWYDAARHSLRTSMGILTYDDTKFWPLYYDEFTQGKCAGGTVWITPIDNLKIVEEKPEVVERQVPATNAASDWNSKPSAVSEFNWPRIFAHSATKQPVQVKGGPLATKDETRILPETKASSLVPEERHVVVTHAPLPKRDPRMVPAVPKRAKAVHVRARQTYELIPAKPQQ